MGVQCDRVILPMSSCDIRMRSDATRGLHHVEKEKHGTNLEWVKNVRPLGVFFLKRQHKGWTEWNASAISNGVFHKESSVPGLSSSWQTYHHPADSQHCEGILNSTQMVPFENNGCHRPNCLAWTKQSRLNWPLCSGKRFVTQTSHCLLSPQHSGWRC